MKTWLSNKIKENKSITRKDVLKKHNNLCFNEVTMFISSNKSLLHLPFKEQVYCWFKDIKEVVLCSSCKGNKVKFIGFVQGYNSYCNKKCAANNKQTLEKRKKTVLERYNVENVLQIDKIREKIKTTTLERYGVEYASQSNEIKTKTKDYFSKKFKVDNPSKLDKNKKAAKERINLKKMKQGVKKKYNVDSVFELKSIQSKVKQTNIKNFGVDNIFKTIDFKKKYKSNKVSKIEEKIKENLQAVSFFYVDKQFDMRVENYLIEIEGSYYHPRKIEYLNFTQLNSILNDKIKYDLVNKLGDYKLLKVQIEDLPKENITLDSLKENSYTPNYLISYNQIIISKDYIKSYKEKYGEKKLMRYTKLLVKFVKEFSIELKNIEEERLIKTIESFLKESKRDFTFFNINMSI